MKQSQKLAIRSSEIRSRLNEIAALEADKVTDDIRNEAEALRTELGTVEVQYRAALEGEGAEERTAAGDFGNGDGEPAEVRALIGRVNIGEYLNPAAAGLGLTGVPVELAAALKVPIAGASGGVMLPWKVLECPEHRVAPRAERRAYTDTGDLDGSVMQRAHSGEADHRIRCQADHPVRSSRSPVGAKRRGGSIMPFSDRLGSMASSSFASILP